ADDLEAVAIGREVKAEMATDGVAAGEEPAHEGLVDDSDVLRVFLIREPDLAAFEKWLADGGEVIGANAIVFNVVCFIAGRRSFTRFDHVAIPVIAHRAAKGHAGAATPGQSFQPYFQLPIDSVEIS